MNTKELSCVVAVADTGNYNIAAQQLFLSASTVSYQIKHLEDELGLLIFEPENRVILTEAGKIIYERALQITDYWSKSVQTAKKLHGEARMPLNIGMRRLMDEEKLAITLERFCQVQQKYGFSLYMYRQGSFIKDLLTGNRDLVFAESTEIEKNSAISFEPLCPSFNGYAVSKIHPLAKKAIIAYADLQNEHIMLPAVAPGSEESPHALLLRKYCPSAVFSYSTEHENAILSAAANTVISAISFSVVSDNPRVVFVPAEGMENLQLGIAWRRDDNTPGVRKFVEIAKEVFSDASRHQK